MLEPWTTEISVNLHILSILSICALAACGGGEGSGGGSAQSPLTLGTTSNTRSANGLAFADAFSEQNGSDIDTALTMSTATVQFVRLRDWDTVSVDLPTGSLVVGEVGTLLFTIAGQSFSSPDPDVTMLRIGDLGGDQVSAYYFQDRSFQDRSFLDRSDFATGFKAIFVLGNETRPSDRSGSATYDLIMTGIGSESGGSIGPFAAGKSRLELKG
jgi:hypothetical protein